MDDDKTKLVSVGQIEINASQTKNPPSYDDLPLIAMRDIVLFPGVTFPVTLGREMSISVANAASEGGIPVGVFCQLIPSTESPAVKDLYEYGVVADILKVFELPDGTKTAIISAREKIKIIGKGKRKTIPGALSAEVRPVRETNPRKNDKEFEALISEIKDTTLNILRKSREMMADLAFNIENLPDPALIINLIATHSPFSLEVKEDMLKINRIKDRGFMLLGELSRNEEYVEIKAEIREKAKQRIDEQQRNAFLQNQFETLREELYGDDDDAQKLREKAEKISFPEPVMKTFEKELDKLSRLNPQSPDYSVQYSYLELLTDLPWGVYDSLSTDFKEAREILDADHYGLEKVKERMLEQIAVLMNKPDGKSPIICLVGAPGVGKTSLGQSIAKALGRKYQRVSLGGLHDEAEIRGHRRTYIGAMPGRIVDALKRVGSSNPILLLDEIDKLGNDFKGDPASALLEVLDPEQNIRFHDNYVDVDFDLSKVMFITTANTLSTIPQPLLDRMEIIEIPGYLLEEKTEIALRHLVPRIKEELGAWDVEFTPEAIKTIVESYTSESGVRQLEKRISSIFRKLILKKMSENEVIDKVDSDKVKELLGVEMFTPERYEVENVPGVATGLAWTAVGGEILFIESVFVKTKGEKLTLTGNLGDVMKESAMIALQVVKSRIEKYSLSSELFENSQLHIHVPEGAVPKDGPSAGITIATSILSAASGKCVKPGIAMTGELTLRGKVLPVGGIKEKILAAKRAGISNIILCKDNRKDIEDIKAEYREGMNFTYVSNIDEVFEHAISKD
ncbi:MAG: endopeptidase La [Lachnoclostridium sp.]|nr:endopeptidase La [Lachnoclostridium sp.]